MSRIGKKMITLPLSVEASVASDLVTIKGPKGVLSIPLVPSVKILKQDETRSLQVTVVDEKDKKQRALWGLVRQLIFNAVQGVQKPFEKSLEFVGVGFKVVMSGTNKLTIEVGFSHPVTFILPKGIEAKIEKNILTIYGIDKQLLGETAARIRRLKPPEPYKGKGIKYTTETIRRKAGKTATKSA